ncbi:alpha/beta-hydrolase [Periconia macrospinosa]|uniref:Alpha/beta-hydrolase n=1 Tax=Periconia macrospinosa TaxID=97972 RepID=A0A2V1DSA1_9PLEO|nr:alpha/beta-hydrolase [Periconia macrospinosa]
MRFSASILAQAYNNQSSIIKTLKTSDGQTYTYDFAPPSDASKPTLLLLHGYPASRHDWATQIKALVAEGFGIVAPDMLGFGDTSKPTAIEAYNGKTISTQLIEILDAENLPQVVGVGHDWGAGVLSKVTTWYPKRFTKLSFVGTPYIPAGLLFDVDGFNKQSLETAGYMSFGYWYFFNSWDAAGIIESHLESFFSIIFTANASSWGTDFADLGAARAWLTANTTQPRPSWITAEYEAQWLSLYRQPNIVPATLNYYQALLRGIHQKDEAQLPDTARYLQVPVLAIGAAQDAILPPEAQRAAIEPWAVAGFEQRILDTGHWVALEKGDELSELLIEFAGSA